MNMCSSTATWTPASAQVRAIVAAERSKRVRQTGLVELRPRPDRPGSTSSREAPGTARRRGNRCGDSPAPPRPPRPAPHCSSCQRSSMLTASHASSGVSAFSSTARPATSEPPIVTSGDRPARRNGVERGDRMRQPLDRRLRLRRRASAPTWSRNPRRSAAAPRPAARPSSAPAARPARAALRRDSRRGRPRHSAPARRERLPLRRNAVDRGIGEAGQRHRARIDRLPRPSAIRRRSPRPALRSGTTQRRSRRRPHRPAVELDRPAAALARDRDVLPEALHSLPRPARPNAS